MRLIYKKSSIHNMLPIIQIGPLSLQFPPLVFIVGVWISLYILEKIFQIKKIEFSTTQNLILSTMIGALFGARLTYVISYPSHFMNSPINIVSPSLSLLDPWGALVGALLSYLIIAKIRGISQVKYTDEIALFLSYLSIFISITNFMAGGKIGQPTNMPWGINYLGALRHPTQLYEALGFLILSYYLSLRFLKTQTETHGYILLEFFFYGSLIKFIVSGFVINQPVTIYNLRFEQLVYFLISVFFLFLITYISTKRNESLNG